MCCNLLFNHHSIVPACFFSLSRSFVLAFCFCVVADAECQGLIFPQPKIIECHKIVRNFIVKEREKKNSMKFYVAFDLISSCSSKCFWVWTAVALEADSKLIIYSTIHFFSFLFVQSCCRRYFRWNAEKVKCDHPFDCVHMEFLVFCIQHNV